MASKHIYLSSSTEELLASLVERTGASSSAVIAEALRKMDNAERVPERPREKRR